MLKRLNTSIFELTPCLLLFLVLCVTNSLYSQEQKQYSTFEYNMDMLMQDSTQRATLKSHERSLHKSQAFVKANNTKYLIQIAYHNLTDWEPSKFLSQLEWQTQALNRDFSAIDETNPKLLSANISFEYRAVTKESQMHTKWKNWNNSKEKDTDTEIHIWVIDLPDTIGSYASWSEGKRENDGIVIDKAYFGQGEYPEYNQGKTLSTLVAMHLGLKPLLGPHPCADDGVRDTPRYESAISCDDKSVSRCGGQNSMPYNIMSPADDSCRSYFTIGQVHRMKYFLEQSSSLSQKIKN